MAVKLALESSRLGSTSGLYDRHVPGWGARGAGDALRHWRGSVCPSHPPEIREVAVRKNPAQQAFSSALCCLEYRVSGARFGNEVSAKGPGIVHAKSPQSKENTCVSEY